MQSLVCVPGAGMSAPRYAGGRLRAYLQFLAALLYFFFARSLAARGADGLVSDAWFPLVEQVMLVFLLLIGFAAMGFWFDRQSHPIDEQGLPRREGWMREVGLGMAAGWGVALRCLSSRRARRGAGCWPMRRFLCCLRWRRRLPIVATHSNALSAHW